MYEFYCNSWFKVKILVCKIGVLLLSLWCLLMEEMILEVFWEVLVSITVFNYATRNFILCVILK